MDTAAAHDAFSDLLGDARGSERDEPAEVEGVQPDAPAALSTQAPTTAPSQRRHVLALVGVVACGLAVAVFAPLLSSSRPTASAPAASAAGAPGAQTVIFKDVRCAFIDGAERSYAKPTRLVSSYTQVVTAFTEPCSKVNRQHPAVPTAASGPGASSSLSAP